MTNHQEKRVLCYKCKKPIHIDDLGGVKSDDGKTEQWFHTWCAPTPKDQEKCECECHETKESCSMCISDPDTCTYSIPAPSPHTEGGEEKSRDLWNWVASNMTNPNDITSIRMAQKFGSEFREKIADVLHQTREDTLAWVDREVIGEDEDEKYLEDHRVLNENMVNPVFAVVAYKYFGQNKFAITNIVENEKISQEIVRVGKNHNSEEYTSEVFDAKVFKWSEKVKELNIFDLPVWTNASYLRNKLRREQRQRLKGGGK